MKCCEFSFKMPSCQTRRPMLFVFVVLKLENYLFIFGGTLFLGPGNMGSDIFGLPGGATIVGKSTPGGSLGGLGGVLGGLGG